MSERNEKKMRQAIRKRELALLAKAIKEIQAWPFKERLKFAMNIIFPPKAAKLRVTHERH